jgi:hypothetical protein
MRRQQLVACPLLLALLGVGCSPYGPGGVGWPPGPRHTEVLAANDFQFGFAKGGWLGGFDVFRLDAKGKAIYVFQPTSGQWRRTTFQVAAADVRALRELLANEGFLQLQPRYVNSDTHDGTMWAFRLDAGGRHKEVNCNNVFPRDAKRLHRFLQDNILAAHKADLTQARSVDPGEMVKALKDLPVW